MLSDAVNKEQIETYKQEGAVLLQGVLDDSWLDVIEIGLDRNIRRPGPFGSEIPNKGAGRFFTDHYNYHVIPEFQFLLRDSLIVDALCDLMETDQAFLYYDQVFYKGEGGSDRTAWHQDFPFYQMADTLQVAGAWIPLEDLEACYTLEYVAGSHLGVEYNTFDVNKPSEVVIDNGKPMLPNIQKERENWDIRSHDMKRGDMLVIHPKLIHGGAGVAEGIQRRTMTVNVFGPDVRYEPKPLELGMRFPGIEKRLKKGDLLRHDFYFPQLRPVVPNAFTAGSGGSIASS